jgi:small subunit ribosomal protein S19e
VAQDRRQDASLKIIREILTQLEEEDLIITREGEGRDITPEGQRLLDTTAGQVLEELDRPDLERYT